MRLAREQDLAEVVELERVTPDAPHWPPQEYAAALSVDPESAVRRCLFVAEAAEGETQRIVGFAVAKVVAGAPAELESVAVAGAYRRGGLGRMLCEAVLAWCREQGATEMELEVRAGSAGAIALYSSLGFQARGVRRLYYRDPAEDAVLMQLDLRASL